MKNSNKIGVIRKTDDLGRVVIPKEFRDKLKFSKNEKVEMELVGNTIVLKKSTDTCIECGNPASDLSNTIEISLCDKCITNIYNKFEKIKDKIK